VLGVIKAYQAGTADETKLAKAMEKPDEVGEQFATLLSELQGAKRAAAARTGGVEDTRSADPSKPNMGSGVQPDTDVIGDMSDVMGEGTGGTAELLKSIDSKIEISPDLLRRLHRIHRQLTDLKGQIDRGPRQIKAGQALVDQATALVQDVRDRLTKATMASDEKQLQLKSREFRIEELEAKLNTAASNREFSTLKEQIAADKQANSVLSDEILEAMDQIEQIEAELQPSEQELAKQKQEQEVRVQEIESSLSDLAKDLERVEAELTETEKEIPAAVFSDYKRLTDSKGEEALAPVDGDSCGGCFQTLTTNHIDRLRLSILIRCPNCNAFLYSPEDRRVK